MRRLGLVTSLEGGNVLRHNVLGSDLQAKRLGRRKFLTHITLWGGLAVLAPSLSACLRSNGVGDSPPNDSPTHPLLGAHATVVSSDAPTFMKDAATVAAPQWGAVFVADGIDDEDTINEAIMSVGSGGLVGLLGGTFTLGGPVLLTSNITLEGAQRGVTLKLADSVLGPVVRVKEASGDVNYAHVKRLTIDGNKDNRPGADDDGISIETAFGCHIKDVTVFNVPRNGIYLHETNGSTISDCVVNLCKHGIELHDNFLKGNIVANNFIYDNRGHAIRLIGEGSECDDNVIANNLLWGGKQTSGPSGEVGIYGFGNGKPVAGNTLIGNKILYFLDGLGAGIYMDNGAYDQQIVGNFINDTLLGIFISRYGAGGQIIKDNYISYTWQDGLEIGSADHIISGNKILEIGRTTASTYSGIILYGTRSMVRDNHISWPEGRGGTPLKYGIEERDNPDPALPDPDDNVISGNMIADADTKIVKLGANTVIRDNKGYVTENSGTSTGTGAEQTIAHGLTGAPNRVFLSNEDDGANPYQGSAADATNIYITAMNQKKYHWKAEAV